MTESTASSNADDPPLSRQLFRIAALSAVAGYVEVIGFIDFKGIYPGVMSGNTIQVGLAVAKEQGGQLATVGAALVLFFAGSLVGSAVKRMARSPALECLMVAALLILAQPARSLFDRAAVVELPLLAFAMAFQGQAISKFGGVSAQTIVVTSNILKFSDAVVGRFVTRGRVAADGLSPPSLADVLVPGVAWLCYGIASGAGALSLHGLRWPLLLPAAVLAVVAFAEARSKQ